MSYYGEELTSCSIPMFRNKDFNVVIVQGSPGNICHHALFNFGGRWGYYVHVAGHWYAKPCYMNESQYGRYLLENGKKELYRNPVIITNPHNFFFTMEQLLSKKWFWGITYHNCATFVEELGRAGGAVPQIVIPQNCPANYLPQDRIYV